MKLDQKYGALLGGEWLILAGLAMLLLLGTCDVRIEFKTESTDRESR